MILNVNKPKGLTSFNIVSQIKKILNTKKVGHAGTLDPLASGVLVILTGKDTKKQDLIMTSDKEYHAKIALGATSQTNDLEGDLITNSNANKVLLTDLKQQISNLLPSFVGSYEQQVPLYSAVKVNGKRLYKSARTQSEHEIEQIVKPVKQVVVYKIDVLSLQNEDFLDCNGNKINLPVLTLSIICAKGFYVRSLARDLGEQLGLGGVLIDLVRTRVGDYTIEQSVSTERLAADGYRL